MSIFNEYLKQISEGTIIKSFGTSRAKMFNQQTAPADAGFIQAQEDSVIAKKLHTAAEIILEVAASIDTEDYLDQLDELFEEIRAMITNMAGQQEDRMRREFQAPGE